MIHLEEEDPVDAETVNYLRFTGRPQAQCDLVEAYYKAQGQPGVTRMGLVAENNPVQPLQPYAGRGFLMFFSPLFGYWDDMVGRDTLAGALQQMTVDLDRVRIANGWPTGADGPPF